MRLKWLQHIGNSDLIIFCNGWGMDERPVNHLDYGQFDVLMFYDYRGLALPDDFNGISRKYKRLYLVSWSMGVWVGQYLFVSEKEIFTDSLAFNGTLCPIHNDYGIPRKIFYDTLDSLDEQTRLKFYRRMCREKSNLDKFLSNQPDRSISEQKEELSFLWHNVDCVKPEESIYNQIIVSDNDWIVPSENQKRYWSIHTVRHIEGFHYFFQLYRRWEQLLHLSEISSR